jgi:DNA repair exonuclease SbcCD ATPase subunit
MNYNDPDRLDRIEKLLESVGYRVDSNARAIEALASNSADYHRDRAHLYQLMADLAQTQAETKQDYQRDRASFYQLMADLAQTELETKKDMYRLLRNLDERETELSRRQGEIVQMLHKLDKRDGEIVQILKLLVAERPPHEDSPEIS